jgi:hypothetical protein
VAAAADGATQLAPPMFPFPLSLPTFPFFPDLLPPFHHYPELQIWAPDASIRASQGWIRWSIGVGSRLPASVRSPWSIGPTVAELIVQGWVHVAPVRDAVNLA